MRECWFEPTFHKHAGQLCAGIQIHVGSAYDHDSFRPWRLIALALVAAGQAVTLLPELPLADSEHDVEVRPIGAVCRGIFAVTRAADAARPSTQALLGAVRDAV